MDLGDSPLAIISRLRTYVGELDSARLDGDAVELRKALGYTLRALAKLRAAHATSHFSTELVDEIRSLKQRAQIADTSRFLHKAWFITEGRPYPGTTARR